MALSRTRGRGDREIVSTQPPSDAYTGILGISLLALVTASVFLFLDYNQYGTKEAPKPPQVNVRPLTGTATPPSPGK